MLLDVKGSFKVYFAAEKQRTCADCPDSGLIPLKSPGEYLMVALIYRSNKTVHVPLTDL